MKKIKREKLSVLFVLLLLQSLLGSASMSTMSLKDREGDALTWKLRMHQPEEAR